MSPTLAAIERNLRRRLAYPYIWGGVQNDRRDRATDFIYSILAFDELLAAIEERFGGSRDYPAWRNYALNRWYNFWSARAVEMIFAAQPGVLPAPNARDRLVDFTLQGIPFDHKTTVFPRAFGHDLAYARRRPEVLLRWLYAHQSRERRYHRRNRLFILLYRDDGAHWRLRAEVGWLAQLIGNYVRNFRRERLHRLQGEDGTVALADLIWAVGPPSADAE